MFEWFNDGGLVMWILLCISLISWAVIFERTWVLFRETKTTLIFKKELDENDYSEQEVGLLVPRYPSVLGAVLGTVCENKHLLREDNTLLTRTRLNEEVGHLERGLTMLEVAAGISPLLGLLGTVLGMVEVFGVIAVVGVGDPSILSGGISKALNTTVFGLVTAIPALAAFSLFDRRINKMTRLIEKCATLTLSGIYANERKRFD